MEVSRGGKTLAGTCCPFSKDTKTQQHRSCRYCNRATDVQRHVVCVTCLRVVALRWGQGWGKRAVLWMTVEYPSYCPRLQRAATVASPASAARLHIQPLLDGGICRALPGPGAQALDQQGGSGLLDKGRSPPLVSRFQPTQPRWPAQVRTPAKRTATARSPNIGVVRQVEPNPPRLRTKRITLYT